MFVGSLRVTSKRLAPTPTTKWRAKRASRCVTGCSRRWPRSQPSGSGGDTGRFAVRVRPGMEVGGGLAVGGRRPRRPSSPPSARSPARSRCAGSACRRRRIPPGPWATRSSSPRPHRCARRRPARRARGLDQHRHLGGVGGQRRTVVARAPARRRSSPRRAGTSRRARILVRPRPAAIRVFGDTLLRLPEGTSLRLVARVVDARQHLVPGQTHRLALGRPLRGLGGHGRTHSGGGGGPHHAGRRPAATSPPSSRSRCIRCRPPSRSRQVMDSGRRRDGGSPPRCGRRSCRVEGDRWRVSSSSSAWRTAPDASSVTCDTSSAEGLVGTSWILGTRPGRQRLTLVVSDRPTVGTTVAADADPLPESTRLDPIATSPSAAVGEPLDEPVAVRVTDSSGTALPDVLIAWAADGGGKIASESPRTDSLGEARARWTLGPRAGVQRAWAQVGSGRAALRVAVEAIASPGPPATIAPVRTTPLRGTAGQPITPAIELRATDRAGNPVPGVTITVRPASGSVGQREAVTDSMGRVAVTWTLGPASGVQRLTASAADGRAIGRAQRAGAGGAGREDRPRGPPRHGARGRAAAPFGGRGRDGCLRERRGGCAGGLREQGREGHARRARVPTRRAARRPAGRSERPRASSGSRRW